MGIKAGMLVVENKLVDNLKGRKLVAGFLKELRTQYILLWCIKLVQVKPLCSKKGMRRRLQDMM